MEMFNKLAFLLLNVNLVYSECGISMERTNKIVGGQEVGGYVYPWFALLTAKTTGEIACGGSLINEKHVLTAAHCFNSLIKVSKEHLYRVVLGVYDNCAPYEETRQFFDVERVFIHEKYKRGEKFYDIALIRLTSPAAFGTWICLPHRVNNHYSEPATVIGFGVTHFGNSRLPCRMMEVNVTKFSKSECMHTLLPLEDVLGPNVICAGDMYEAVSSCNGDSGGPLMTMTRDGRYVVAGIVSYGYRCEGPGLPGIYTDVASYLPWIHAKMENTPTFNESPNMMIRHNQRKPSTLKSAKYLKASSNYLKRNPKSKRTEEFKEVAKNNCKQSCRCGVSILNKGDRMVGGSQPPAHSYPWMAYLFKKGELNNDIFFCGGTLISDQYILTAAHCFRDYFDNIGKGIREIKVKLGEHNTTDPSNRLRQIYNVMDIIIYNGYRNSRYCPHNDTALVKLDKRVKFNRGIATACLPKPDTKVEGEFATVAGWGCTSDMDLSFSEILRQTKLRVLTKEECKLKWPKDKINNKMVCAGDAFGQSACHGDSGGGLMLTNKNKRMVVIGITSFVGDPFAEEHQPNVFTKVTPYLDWILKNTQDSCYCL